MDDFKLFSLTKEHIALIKHMLVGWEDCEFGAPAVDCKRPYGNSDVYCDIADILGIEYGEDELTQEQYDYMKQLHYETATAIQILLSQADCLETGTYGADKYGNNWEQIV